MCLERMKEKVEPFHIGYRVMVKTYSNHYCSMYYWAGNEEKGNYPLIKKGDWVDERPYRPITCLLATGTKDFLFMDSCSASRIFNPGWHVIKSLEATIKYQREECLGHVIVRVECYGLDEPYGLGLAHGEDAGCFQFMKILEEVK